MDVVDARDVINNVHTKWSKITEKLMATGHSSCF